VNDALGDVQSVLVLGGSSEIGQAIVRELAGRRLRTVVLAVRRADSVTGFAAELHARSVDVDVVAFDADRTETHAEVIGRVFDRHGDIDVVVLAFAVLGDQAAFDADTEAAVAAVHTNVTGAISSGLVVADRLRRQGHGTLVVLSSVAGERVRAANFVYGATKAAIDGFAQGLGDALRPSGARVLVVRPGFVRTKMTAGMPEAPFATTPEVVARDTVAALRAGKELAWSPRVLRAVFAVLRHLPRAVFRRLPG
jgi:decaprenylphospho-beta-D-erythro-pentofuranosid-2-ulose 2-reductase